MYSMDLETCYVQEHYHGTMPGSPEAKAERDVFPLRHCLLESEAVGEY